jgi:hypothetical protein
VVRSVQTVQPTGAAQVISKARLVDVPKRIPPKLPERNPNRSGPVVVDASPNDEAFNGTSKHDSAPDMGSEKDTQTDDLKQKMDDVRLDDDADDEDDELRPNPWAKVEETRKREAEELSPASPTIPGAFAQ